MMIFSILLVMFFTESMLSFKIQSKVSRTVKVPVSMKIGLYYGTSTGNTENVAGIIHGLSDEIEVFAEIDEFETGK